MDDMERGTMMFVMYFASGTALLGAVILICALLGIPKPYGIALFFLLGGGWLAINLQNKLRKDECKKSG